MSQQLLETIPHRSPLFKPLPKPQPRLRLDLAPVLAEAMENSPLRMDARRHAALKRGKLAPEARIDLHGMTLAQAHGILTRFILDAAATGKRLVLVITGKGRGSGDGERIGALRHQVPQWLNLPPLSARVLQVTRAHVRHGGEGAYYVYLSRAR